VTTFSDVLARRLRQDPAQPLITFYDHRTGERTELSVTTYANWVAKAASLLADELDLERGQSLRLDLGRPHWLTPVLLGAAWTVGLVLTTRDDPDAVVCGPDSLERWAPEARDRVVLACSLLPLGVRFADPVPAGVHDVGIEVWSQPDVFAPWDPPDGDEPAYDAGAEGGPVTQAQLMEAAAAGSLLTDGGRLVSVADPASPPGTSTFTEPLARSGSLVLVARPDPGRLDATYADERATHRAPGATG